MHDAVDRGEAESGSPTGRFGRKKRLEDFGLGGRVDAGSRVVDAQPDIGASCAGVMSGSPYLVWKHLTGIDGQGAAMRHRVASVDGQVEQHLFELHGVGLDPSRTGVELEHDRDVFADQALEQCHKIADHAMQIQRDRVQHLLAAEGQQLAGQRRAAFAGALNFLHEVPGRRILAQFLKKDCAIAENDGHDVVEVVRHAASQSTDRFHFLRLPQLVFQLASIRNIFRNAAQAIHLARVGAMNHHAIVNPPGLPVGSYDAIQQLHVPSRGPGQFRVIHLGHHPLVVRMHAIAPEFGVFIKPGGRQSPDSLEGRVHVKDLRRLRLGEPHALIQIVGEVIEPFFAREPGPFRPPMFPYFILQPAVGMGQVGRAFGDAMFKVALGRS